MNFVTLEIFVYILFVLFLIYKLDALRFFEGLGVLRVTIISLILFCTILGQGLKNNKLTYPFSYWGMYSDKYTGNTYTEFLISLDDGTELHYPFRDLTFFSRRAFMRKVENMDRIVNRFPDSDEMVARVDQKKLDSFLTGLTLIYERQNPDSKVVRFDIYLVSIPVHNWQGLESLHRTPSYTLEINGEL